MLEHAQLPDTDRRTNVTEPVVEAHSLMLVVRNAFARLCRKVTRTIHQSLVVARKHASGRSCNDLVTVERERAETTKGAGMLSLVVGT